MAVCRTGRCPEGSGRSFADRPFRLRRPLRRRLFHPGSGGCASCRFRGAGGFPPQDVAYSRYAAARGVVRFRRGGRRHRRDVCRGVGFAAGMPGRAGQRPSGAGRQQQLRSPRTSGRCHRGRPEQGARAHDPRIRPLARRQRPAGRELRGCEKGGVHRRRKERRPVRRLSGRRREHDRRSDRFGGRPPHRNRGRDASRSAAFRRLYGRRHGRVSGRGRFPDGPREPGRIRRRAGPCGRRQDDDGFVGAVVFGRCG